jgi:hypothetical protein
MAVAREDDRDPRQLTPLMRWLEAKRAARGAEPAETGADQRSPIRDERVESPAIGSRCSAGDERIRELDAHYLSDTNRFSRGPLVAAEALAQSATIAGRHNEAHEHHETAERERRRLQMRELRAQSHLARVHKLRSQRRLDERRRGKLSLPLTPKRQQRGCSGRPRGRAHRASRITRAGPGRSSDGPGEPGDEEPPAGRREVRPPTALGRLRR